ncbi:outer membrane beta-barrel protein [candidate division KSB1 bacterium]|nr:outer membrane beta-barrel protein [candidate division KSB1 bacterium]
MKRHCISGIITTLILLSVSGAFSQTAGNIKKDLGVGFNVGGHQIYGDTYTKSSIGLGFEGLVNYTFRKNKFGVISSLGVGWIKGTDTDKNQDFDTNLLTLDIKAAYWPLLGNKISPYGYIGLGAFNFSLPYNHSRRYFDASFILGAALEYMVNPKLGLNTTFDYRYTTGDNLDLRTGDATDGYLNARVGFTFYFNDRGSAKPDLFDKDKIIAEKAPIDEFGDFSMEENESASGTLDNEELEQLRTKVSGLSEAVNVKQSEIQELKLLIGSREEKIEKLEKGIISPRSSAGASFALSDNFSADYERALQTFYERDYDSAVQMFGSLIQAEHNHRLSSNCHYWIGESYYGKRDYQNAIDAFGKVLDFQNSPKLDDALLMMGLSYMRIGRNTMARESFERIIMNYPDSEYREKAENYLGVLE